METQFDIRNFIMDNKRNLIIGGGALAGLVIIALGAWYFLNGSVSDPLKNQEVSTAEPIDIVLDFYEPWLSAVQSTSTDPYKSGLADAPLLGHDLRERIKDAEGADEGSVDPVLCQVATPSAISARLVSQTEEMTRVLVMSRDKDQTAQAVAVLLRHNDGWYINDIECSAGEFAPEREFSFDTEGYLLKSVVPPLDSKYWHLIFEQDGVPGHAVPLFFSGDSMCKDIDGNESVCNPDQFTEPSKAYVQGQMTEMGVEVKKLELREME